MRNYQRSVQNRTVLDGRRKYWTAKVEPSTFGFRTTVDSAIPQWRTYGDSDIANDFETTLVSFTIIMGSMRRL